MGLKACKMVAVFSYVNSLVFKVSISIQSGSEINFPSLSAFREEKKEEKKSIQKVFLGRVTRAFLSRVQHHFVARG